MFTTLSNERRRAIRRSLAALIALNGSLLVGSLQNTAAAGPERAVTLETAAAHPAQTTPVGTGCRTNELFFDGSCRDAGWVQSRFVTAGATFVQMEGSRGRDANGVVITEMPNPRTVTVRAISDRKALRPAMGARSAGSGEELGSIEGSVWIDRDEFSREYLGGYEVLGESITTSWIDEEGFRHRLVTVNQLDGATYGTVSWEHDVHGYWRSWRWGSDLCFDVLGNPIENCGPVTAIPSSGASGEACEQEGERAGAATGLTCLGILAGATMVVTGWPSS